MDIRPIGVFDSGVGGLTVAKQVIRELPNENIIYFGDTARVPYGNKSKDTVTKFSKQIVRFLLTKNVKSVIIGCNTVSSNSLEELKESFDIPFFDVVEAGVEEAIKITKNKKVGIIGTTATIRSNAYKKSIYKNDNKIEVFSKACPLFVPLVEEGWFDSEVTRLTAKEYLSELICKDVDSIVLGCTHYPFLKKCIGEIIGEDIRLIDPARTTALKVKKFLEENNILNELNHKPEYVFYLSDTTDTFSMICKEALKKIYIPEKIDIEKY